MPTHTLTSVATLFRDSGLLSADAVRELDGLRGGCGGPEDLVRAALEHGWLTAYQAQETLSGRSPELFVGEYVVLAPLGEGAMSRVFKALRRPTGQTVALKVPRTDLPEPGAAAERLYQEGQAGLRLSHPNVIRTLAVVRDGPVCFLVLEYIEGMSLAQLVQSQGPLPAGPACDYVRQASLGLQYAFEHGLVHRDVKPSNLLLSAGRPVIKVLDLGIASPVGTRPESGPAGAGTPDYVAPEQVAVPDRADVRSDVYSLGCTLYHLLTGVPPFPGGSIEDKLRRHLGAEPEPLTRLRPDLPAGLEEILGRMLAKSPGDRFPIPAAVGDALRPFAQGDKVPLVLDLGEGLAGLAPGQDTEILPGEARRPGRPGG